MPDLKKTVEIIFEGTDKISDTVRVMDRRVQDFGRNLDSFADPFSDAAKLVAGLDAALLALGAGGLAYAYAQSSRFESSQVELKKVMEENPVSLRAAEDAAISLSNKYGQAASDILQSTADFKQAGFDIDGAMQLTADAMDLVIAGSLEASQSSEILIAALKGFQAPAEDARRLMDVLNETSNNYATGVGELGIGIAKLSPILSQMGYDYEQSAGLLTPVIEVFRSGEESARGLKTGLLNLLADTPKVSEALASIGVSQRDANGELRSGKDILHDVQMAWGGLNENQQVYLTQQLAGKDQAAKMAVVFGSLEKQLEITAGAYASAGSIAVEVEAQLASSEKVLARLGTGFENLGIVVGRGFADAANEAVGGSTAIVNALQAAVEGGAFDPVLAAISEAGEKIGATFQDLADTLPEALEMVDWSGILDSFDDLYHVFADIFEGFDPTDSDQVAAAVQAVVDTIESLVRTTQGMAEIWAPIVQGIAGVVQAFNSLDDSTKETVGNVLGLASAVTTFSGAFLAVAGIPALIVKLTASLVGLSKAPFKGIVGGLSSLTSGWGLAATAIVLLSKKMVDWSDSLAEVAYKQKEIEPITELTLSLDDGNVLDVLTGIISDAQGNVISVPVEFETEEEEAAEAALKASEAMRQALQEGVSDSVINYMAQPTVESLSAALDEMGVLVKEKIPGEIPTTIAPELDEAKADEVQKTLDSTFLKELEIKADIDIAGIQAQSKTAQAALEWTAQVDIAQAESAAQEVEAAFASINAAITSTGTTMSSLFGELSGGNLWGSDKSTLLKSIQKEEERREKSFESQQKLTDAEIELLKARKEAIDRGDSAITINCDGVEPALEMIMWQIIEKVQVRANESGAEFLLGI